MAKSIIINRLSTLLIKPLLILALLACSACEPAPNNYNNSSLSKKDSIPIWIKESRNLNLPKPQRYKLLLKAQTEIETILNDSIKTKYYSKLSLGYLRIPDSSLFRKTNNKTLTLARITKDSFSIAEAHWDLGEFFRLNVIQDSAYYHFSKAQQLFNTLGNQLLFGRMTYNMAAVQSDIKDYTGSEINTIKAIKIFKPLNEYKHLYECYNNLGSIYNSIGEYDKSFDFYQEALANLKLLKISNRSNYNLFNNIGSLYLNKKEFQKASVYFNKVLIMNDLIISEPLLYAKTLSNYNFARIKLIDTVGVYNSLINTLSIQDSINDIVGMSLTNYYLAEYALVKKDTISAIAYAKTSNSLAKKSTNNKRVLESLELISNLDTKNAVKYVQEYIQLNDSLQKEERQIRNKFARIEFETDQFIEQNHLLARQKQLWLGVAVGLFFLALAIVSIIALRIKNQKLKFNQQQQESNLEIFNLMLSQKEKFLEGKHEEQKRVSEELHDGILGQMLGIRLILSGLNNKTGEASTKQRAEYLKKLQEVEEEVRTISHELNHAAYQKIYNFINSVQDLVKTIESSSQIHCSFEYTTDLEWDRLNSEVKINIYRILQESLQNCVKHALAKNIEVILGANEKDILVKVSDDGVGYQVKKGKKGIGLKNITSRAQKMNGNIDIKSKVGKGTTLLVHIPYENSLETYNPIQPSSPNEV